MYSPQRINIKEVPASQVYQIRQEVLRRGRPAIECVFQGDTLKDTFHLGLFEDEHLVAVASFMNRSSERFEQPFQYQLRGMAVLPTSKGKGYGGALLREGESQLGKRKKQCLLWFNARDSAIGFYEKFGYRTIGEKFDIPGVCQHIVMYKPL